MAAKYKKTQLKRSKSSTTAEHEAPIRLSERNTCDPVLLFMQNIPYLIVAEFIATKYRALSGTTMQITYALGTIIISGVAFLKYPHFHISSIIILTWDSVVSAHMPPFYLSIMFMHNLSNKYYTPIHPKCC